VGGISEKGDLELSGVVQKAWLSFAAHGNPNRLGDLSGQDWPKYHSGAFVLTCLRLFIGLALQAQAQTQAQTHWQITNMKFLRVGI
jgi:carboxylesterase type B